MSKNKKRVAPAVEGGRSRLYVYISEEEKDFLVDIASKNNTTMSAIVNEWILEKKENDIRLDLKFDKKKRGESE